MGPTIKTSSAISTRAALSREGSDGGSTAIEIPPPFQRATGSIIGQFAELEPAGIPAQGPNVTEPGGRVRQLQTRSAVVPLAPHTRLDRHTNSMGRGAPSDTRVGAAVLFDWNAIC